MMNPGIQSVSQVQSGIQSLPGRQLPIACRSSTGTWTRLPWEGTSSPIANLD